MDLEGEDKIVSVALVEAAVADEAPDRRRTDEPPADRDETGDPPCADSGGTA